MKTIKPLLIMMLILALAIVFCSCGETFAVTTTVETAAEPSGETETETSSRIVTDIDDGFENGDASMDDHKDTLFFEGNGDCSITSLCFEKGHNYTFYVKYSGKDSFFSVELFDDNGRFDNLISNDICSEYTGSKTISGNDDLSNAYINIGSKGYWTIEIIKQ